MKKAIGLPLLLIIAFVLWWPTWDKSAERAVPEIKAQFIADSSSLIAIARLIIENQNYLDKDSANAYFSTVYQAEPLLDEHHRKLNALNKWIPSERYRAVIAYYDDNPKRISTVVFYPEEEFMSDKIFIHKVDWSLLYYIDDKQKKNYTRHSRKEIEVRIAPHWYVNFVFDGFDM